MTVLLGDINLIGDFFVKQPIFSIIILVIAGMIWFCFWTLYRQLSNHLPTQIKGVKQEVKEVKEEVKEINKTLKVFLRSPVNSILSD